MKLLIALIIALMGVVAMGFLLNHSMEMAAKDLERQVSQVSQEVQYGSWQEANKHTEDFEKSWKQKQTWWPLVLEHQEMDNIEFSLAKTKEYIRVQNQALSLGQLSELKIMIMHLPKKEALELKNIL